MKKKFTYFIALAALSTTLVACGSKQETVATPAPETVVDTNTTVEETPETEETPAPSDEISDVTTEETPEVETENAEDTTSKDTEDAPTANKPQTNTNSSATSKPQTNTNSSTTSKPQTNTNSNTASKPQTNTNSNTASKPQTNTNSNTASKPQTSTNNSTTSKPQTNTNTNTKPTPSPTPEASTKPETTLSASEVFDKVVAGVELPATMEMDSAMLGDIYGLDTSILKSFKVVAPMMSAHITEIAVFEVNNASDIQTVKNAIEYRTGGIDPRHLYPSLQEAFDNRQTVVKDNYVFFAMDASVDTLVANFNNAVK